MRVRSNAAIQSGVQVTIQCLHRDLAITDAAKRRVDRGPALGVVRHVGYEHGVRYHTFRLPLQQIGQDFTARFLLSFDEKAHVDGWVAVSHDRLESLHDREQLSLVVRSTPGIDVAVADGRFKRRSVPEAQRIGWLDVVMPVDQDGRFSRSRRAFGPHHRMRLAGEEGSLASQVRQVICNPLCRPPAVVVVFRQGRNTGNTKELAEFIQDCPFALANELVDAHESNMTMESRLGEGSI